MGSRDERRAEFARREVERKAKYRERMDGLRAKVAAEKKARVAARVAPKSCQPRTSAVVTGASVGMVARHPAGKLERFGRVGR